MQGGEGRVWLAALPLFPIVCEEVGVAYLDLEHVQGALNVAAGEAAAASALAPVGRLHRSALFGGECLRVGVRLRGAGWSAAATFFTQTCTHRHIDLDASRAALRRPGPESADTYGLDL
ncbi:hypothetical protein GCM10010872_14160 [Dyella flava]|nr:hypothetical protein GCM10010872_14160 [Dyella flava]